MKKVKNVVKYAVRRIKNPSMDPEVIDGQYGWWFAWEQDPDPLTYWERRWKKLAKGREEKRDGNI